MSVTLQIADRFVKAPRGLLKDVLVKVHNFYYPADFIVLDMEPVHHTCLKVQTPVILGRPFLATTNVKIAVRSGVMEVSFGNIKMSLNMYSSSHQPKVEQECYSINIIHELVDDALPFVLAEDPLEACLSHYGLEELSINSSITEVNNLLDFTHLMDVLACWTPFEPLSSLASTPTPTSI